MLTSRAPVSQNGQTHSFSSLVVANDCLSVFEYFVGLGLKGILLIQLFEKMDFLYIDVVDHYFPKTQLKIKKP